ncbi:MAG: CvpA family protein [Candidatus Omnitrophota bacterium]
MFSQIKNQINWLDLFVIIILIRICYVAIKTGFPIELFKILGVILATYLSLHYFSGLSSSLLILIGSKNIPSVFLSLLSFMFLAGAGFLFFSFLRRIFFKLVKMEAVSALNKWGGLVLGITRGFLFASLVIFIFVISGIGYLKKSVTVSYSGKAIFKIAPATYAWAFNGLVSKLVTGEKFNQSILDVEKDLK